GELRQCGLRSIVSDHAIDDARDFLAVRADVLNLRPAYGTWNHGQALHATQVTRHHRADELIPRLTRPDMCDGVAVHLAQGDSSHHHVQDDTWESFIGDDEVAAAAEHEQREIMLDAPGVDRVDVRGRVGSPKPSRRAANPQGAERLERQVLAESQ